MLCVGFFQFSEGKMEREQEMCETCVICGSPVTEGMLCDCCKDSLMLCDIEDYPQRKAVGKICLHAGGNAFKKGGFMVQ